MKRIIITYRQKKSQTKIPVKKQLLWYDSVRSEMLQFSGGQLEFEYKEDEYLVKMGESGRKSRGINSTYRLLPKVVEVKESSTILVSNKEDFKKFLNNYINYNDVEIEVEESNDQSICNIPDNSVDDFCYQLERNGFEYDIE